MEKNEAMAAYYRAKIDALDAGMTNAQAESYAKVEAYEALARQRDAQADAAKNRNNGYTQEETITVDNGFGNPKKTTKTTVRRQNAKSGGDYSQYEVGKGRDYSQYEVTK